MTDKACIPETSTARWWDLKKRDLEQNFVTGSKHTTYYQVTHIFPSMLLKKNPLRRWHM